jgi:hypothetical protein
MTWAGVLADGDQRVVDDEHRYLACHQLGRMAECDQPPGTARAAC